MISPSPMSDSNIPLPERLRPRDLSEIIGQDHLLGEQAPLRQMIDQGHLPSIIFWGPPGVGKTTIALLLAQAIDRPFVSLSALNTGVKELREIIADGGDLMTPVVFIDEIHRFNKSQQDALLNAVEKGKITLIGATTENPSFEVNSALLSRCQVYTLNALDADAIQTLLLQIVFFIFNHRSGTLHRKLLLLLSEVVPSFHLSVVLHPPSGMGGSVRHIYPVPACGKAEDAFFLHCQVCGHMRQYHGFLSLYH